MNLVSRSADISLPCKTTAEGLNWAENADLLYPSIMRIISNVLETLTSDGVYSEERVGNLIGSCSLRWPVPAQSLRIAQDFIREFCTSAARPSQETIKFLTCSLHIQKHHKCFVVFYGGHDHYYYDQLPEEILALRKTILFWIWPAQHEFCSQGRGRKSLRPQTLSVLRFLASKQNAGQTISIADVYWNIWHTNPPSDDKMTNSVGVEISALNRFTAPAQFECASGTDALIILAAKAYIIKKELASQCCIIREIEQNLTNHKICKSV